MARLPKPTGGYKSIEIKSIWPGTQVITDTGASQRVNYDSHFYQIQITYPPQQRREYQQVIGFLQAQKGSLGSFEISLDYFKDSTGYAGTATPGNRPADDNLYVDGAFVRGDSTINFRSNWSSVYYDYGTNGNFLEVGDYITFAGHNKLYQITDLFNPNTAGEGQITVAPPLMADIADAEVISYTDVEAQVFMNDKALVYSAGEYGWSEIALNLMEEI